MLAEAGRPIPTRRATWRRGGAILVCVLAVLVTLLGHVEYPLAAPVHAGQAIVTVDPGHGHPDAGAGTEAPHCLHHGACPGQWMLPRGAALVPPIPARPEITAPRIGSGRTVPPLRRPPRPAA